MKIKMLHTCMRVMDLEASMKFYTEALGLEELSRKDFPEHEFTLVFLADESRLYQIELTYNYKPDAPYVIGNGFGHLAFGVDNLEAARAKHIEMGYKATELMGLPNTVPSYYFLDDPDGYQIEMIRNK